MKEEKLLKTKTATPADERILNDGVPSPTKSRRAYTQAIASLGWETAHRKVLIELKAWLDADSEYSGRPAKIAEQAYLLDAAFTSMARDFDLDAVPSIQVRDAIFSDVFGAAGKQLVEHKQAEADEEVRAFMQENGISDESEARSLLSDMMMAGIEFGAENMSRIAHRVDIMGQIEDVIGPVDWGNTEKR
jgi:hypothetical protein